MRCPICHGEGADVSCLLCSEPHHRSCWEYNDSKCSVYACPSRHNSSQLKEFQEIYKKNLPQQRKSIPPNVRNTKYDALADPLALALTTLVIITLTLFIVLPEKETRVSSSKFDNRIIPYINVLVSRHISRNLPVSVNKYGKIIIEKQKLFANF